MKLFYAWLAVAVLASVAPIAKGGDCCEQCQHCGCQDGCQKYCRVVCEMKKVPKVCYTCECEEFCVPGPSLRCGDKCVPDPCDTCCNPRTIRKPIYTPQCGDVRVRHKLGKHEVMVEVPTYKWVVENLCGNCAGQCGAQVQTGAEGSEAPNAGPMDPEPQPSAPAPEKRTSAPRKGFLPIFAGK